MSHVIFYTTYAECERCLDEFVGMNRQPLAWYGIEFKYDSNGWFTNNATWIPEEVIRQRFSIPSQVYALWWTTFVDTR